ncbi:hypothetical protein ACFYSF_48470, partial [Streptomyces canus]|uniref:hypothetical protein n=1 Tax=Streptomyces canus TaxID=58343 RepID=UPI0036BBE5F9
MPDIIGAGAWTARRSVGHLGYCRERAFVQRPSLVTLVLLALTKPLDVPVGDQTDGESEEGLVNVVASF